ncbi:hypothetical protein K438DRAFT_1955458 [Mycena galopus ATCC 62051]|nr:hypothetical protein K438DRAFT_1955458 [Mycena galopus ATCC 62051]
MVSKRPAEPVSIPLFGCTRDRYPRQMLVCALQYHQHVSRTQRAPLHRQRRLRRFLIRHRHLLSLPHNAPPRYIPNTTPTSPAPAAPHSSPPRASFQCRPSPLLTPALGTHYEHDAHDQRRALSLRQSFAHAIHVAYPFTATVFSAAPLSAQSQALSCSASMARPTPSVRNTRCRVDLPSPLDVCTYLGTVPSTICVGSMRPEHSPSPTPRVHSSPPRGAVGHERRDEDKDEDGNGGEFVRKPAPAAWVAPGTELQRSVDKLKVDADAHAHPKRAHRGAELAAYEVTLVGARHGRAGRGYEEHGVCAQARAHQRRREHADTMSTPGTAPPLQARTLRPRTSNKKAVGYASTGLFSFSFDHSFSPSRAASFSKNFDTYFGRILCLKARPNMTAQCGAAVTRCSGFSSQGNEAVWSFLGPGQWGRR